ncbi:MAG: hypothetical protein FWD57_09165 [Polyangiaceae bacterium]|nr:hypothetical protein [Polyangiaceae bacterium]
MRYRCSLVVLTAAALAGPICGCSRNLDKETAEKLLVEKLYTGKAECSVDVTKQSDVLWTFRTTDDTRKLCLAGLGNAGLVRKGKCFDSSCFLYEIEATEKSRLSGGELKFDCGDWKFYGVTSITTRENEATAKVDREMVLNHQLMGQIANCNVTKPAVGRAEIERSFSRDDAGKWSLK